MLAVPTYCSEADGYSAHKEIFLSLNATCLDAHSVPSLIRLITRVVKYRPSAFLNGVTFSHVLKKICALSPVLRATFPGCHGFTQITILGVNYWFSAKRCKENL
jgi:hypothetical protein